MKTPLVFLLAALSSVAFNVSVSAQGTAFTYQGRLNDGANSANGIYDLRFETYGAASGGAALGRPLTNSATSVSNGLFTVTLDFGAGVFPGAERWLEIGVRPTGPDAFTTLMPRQQITATPYAIKAGGVTGPINGALITAGTITGAQLASNSITAAQLAPGAAAANLGTNGIAGLPTTSIVLSEREVNDSLLNAGFIPLGTQITNRPDAWTAIASGPPDTGALSFGRYNHAAVWVASLGEMFILGGYPNRNGLRYRLSLNSWTQISSTNAPNLVEDTVAFWTGTRLLAWDTRAHSGGRYNPSNNTWQDVSDVNAPSSREQCVAVWAGTRLLIWGGHPPGSAATHYADGRSYDPVTDTWQTISDVQPQFARSQASAVWTGTEMIVAGGYSSALSGDVLRYNPATDNWTGGLVPPEARRYGHTAVWTGSRMILVGGYNNFDFATTGIQYDPAGPSWTAIASTAVLAELAGHNAVWSGTHMYIWGGESNPNGARYTPASDTWTTLPSPGPGARVSSSTVWTGSDLLCWGGYFLSNEADTDDGRRYNQTTNVWTALSAPPATGEPGERNDATAVWTGDRLVVWGGNYLGTDLRTGGIYRPGIGWTNTPTATAPSARSGHSAVWTGTEMIVWGGADGFTVNSGARFHVASNRWFTMTSSNAPTPRRNHSAIWTGTEMIIWGGYQLSNSLSATFLKTGARYNPVANQWDTNFPLNGIFSGRANHTAVWTGTEMLLWGGYSQSGSIFSPTFTYYGNGVRYVPGSNSLPLLPFAPPGNARTDHSAVWTGSEMILWGGLNANGETNSGVRFNPVANTWTALPTNSAPSPRAGHTADWTGEWMITYGGSEGGSPVGGTSLFNPAANKWFPATTNVAGRFRHVSAWTGTDLLVGSGQIGSAPTNTFKSFTPRRVYHFYQKL